MMDDTTGQTPGSEMNGPEIGPVEGIPAVRGAESRQAALQILPVDAAKGCDYWVAFFKPGSVSVQSLLSQVTDIGQLFHIRD